MEKIRLLLLVPLLSVQCFMVCLAITTPTNLITDQAALLALKAHITLNPYNVLAYNWSTATSCCSWIGVTCGHRHQRVTVLNLANMGLTGTIPTHIGNLSFLASLNIRNNSFHDNLPDQLAFLRRLKDINLGSNNFNGNIPSWIGLFPQLQSLGLANNNFSGSIPSSIYNMSFLQILNLGYNSLSGSLPEYMCSHLLELESLYLYSNQLYGQIPSTLNECRRLQILSLWGNKITGNIPKEIGNLTMLTTLDLSNNSLTGAIPHELVNLGNLVIFRSDFNGLTGAIPPKLFNISTLESISLVDNSLSGQLPPRIDLGLPNLKYMYLWRNELSGIIPISISNASKLTELDLGHNSFTGLMPDTLGNLRLLEWLSVGENSLIIQPSVLTSLTNCQNLRILVVSSNQWNGILPTSIGNFSASFERFYAYDCNMKGHIPREIGNLSNLLLIGLASNQLIGTIPPTVGRLQNLQGLDFEENKLQGSIPYDLCLSRRLVYLFLFGNKLSGQIPACLGNLTSLQELYLNSNELISIIPSTLSTLISLLKLNLSSNYLSGNLPLEIASLKVVTEIDVSKNLFTGHIPSIIGSLQRLRTLSLAHNEFEGPIPPSFGDLVSLELLDLSHNILSGAIPKSLEKLEYLKILDASSNRLKGEIPNRGPFANISAESFLLNDALCGAPRFQVPPCKNGTPRRLSKAVVLVLKYGLPTIVITVIVLLFVFIRCRKKNERVPTQTELLPIAFRRISYQEILQATNGFNECNLLGNGSFGYVYKGILSDEQTVAIKVFNLQLEGAFKSFDVECEVLRNIRHRNLIKVISSCSNNLDFKALVLDYMPNESLEKWLYSQNFYLDIQQRLNIMMDVAFGLEYLHHGYSTPIVHCDLKPNNILLDRDMVAHVADFGISKLLGEEEFIKQTVTLATIGYMAPEYGTEGIVSTKGDVFSYGIMLMETFTRKKPTDESFTEELNLKRWVSDSIHNSINLVDSNLLRREEEHFVAKEQCLSSVFGLALKCCADSPEERISMKDVVLGLTKIKHTLVTRIGRA